MKIAAAIARYLLGVVFVFFGSNLIIPFLPTPPLPPGPMAQFSTALATSHYIVVIGVFQLVPGLLLLINRYVPAALAVLAAVIVNIDCTHVFMAPSGLPLAAVVTILWFLAMYPVRSAFVPLLKARLQA